MKAKKNEVCGKIAACHAPDSLHHRQWSGLFQGRNLSKGGADRDECFDSAGQYGRVEGDMGLPLGRS